MSLTDVVSSTLSTVVNHFIIVVNEQDVAVNSSNSYMHDVYDSSISTSTNISKPVSIPVKTVYKYVNIGQGVAHGFSQEKIISVMCMLIILCIFGCLGNGLVLYVFTKKNDKVTSTIFILALAWTDFFTCLVIIPFTVANIGLDSRFYSDFLCKTFQFLITSNVPLSAFIMVAIAVDRYFSICHPFMRVVTPRRARIAIICLVLVACTLGSITACIYGVWRPGLSQTDADNSSNDAINGTFQEQTTVSLSEIAEASERISLSDPASMRVDKSVEIVVDHTSLLVSRENVSDTEFEYFSSQENTRIVTLEHMEGYCITHETIFSLRFTELYQKIYISFYIISLLAVFTLYFFIYRSVAKRRAWRRKQKSSTHAPMALSTAAVDVDNGKTVVDLISDKQELFELAPPSSSREASNSSKNNCENNREGTHHPNTSKKPSKTDSTPLKNCSHENGLEESNTNSTAEKKTNRERRDFNFLANIRTALMLFVVTLVFIINFLPAWLMATHLIDFEIIIFYTHYIYNVANPVIYAFMNQSFRKELKRVFQRGTHLLRGG